MNFSDKNNVFQSFEIQNVNFSALCDSFKTFNLNNHGISSMDEMDKMDCSSDISSDFYSSDDATSFEDEAYEQLEVTAESNSNTSLEELSKPRKVGFCSDNEVSGYLSKVDDKEESSHIPWCNNHCSGVMCCDGVGSKGCLVAGAKQNLFKISNYSVTSSNNIMLGSDNEYIEEQTSIPNGYHCKQEITSGITHPTPNPKEPPYVVGYSYSRTKRYSNTILKNGFYETYANSLIPKDLKPYMVPPEQYLANIVSLLLPNKVTIESFKNTQKANTWLYYKNSERKEDYLPLRWCDQYQNFYEPFVYRYRTGFKGNCLEKQGLCPYCSTSKSANLNDHFYDMGDPSYLQHLCKFHGVLESGQEVEPPIFVKSSGLYYTICATCGESFKPIGQIEQLKVGLFNYFDHFCTFHNHKFTHCRNAKLDNPTIAVNPCSRFNVKDDDLMVEVDSDEEEEEEVDKCVFDLNYELRQYAKTTSKRRFWCYHNKFRKEYGNH